MLSTQTIKQIIKASIVKHLVQHTPISKSDNRCRIDVMIDEATEQIIKVTTKEK